jgi:transposase InsO family protein
MKYWQYSAWMKLAENCFHFDKSDPAKFRHHALMHYYLHGYQATCDALGVSKSTLFRWKQAYEFSKKRLASLVPKSTKPKTVRYMQTDPRLIEFIKALRETYGHLGKVKIKLFLDEYAHSMGISFIGLTTIGKIIKRRNFFFETPRCRRRRPFNRERTRTSPKVTKPGYLQMDGLVVYANQVKHCFITIIDVYTKYAQVVKVPTLSSKQSLYCYHQFVSQYTVPIHTIQTDNGSEFLKSFHAYLETHKIKHVFSYPRSPRVNGYVERFNRTIQEEFIYRTDELYYDLDAFQEKLTKYLNWYNFKRPHASLNYQTPVSFLLNSISTPIPKCG